MSIVAQYYSHPLDGPRLLRRRMDQYSFLPRRCLFRSDRQLLRSLLYRRFLRPHVPLHRPRSTQPKGLFPRNPTKDMALAAESLSKMEVVWWRTPLEKPAQWIDMV